MLHGHKPLAVVAWALLAGFAVLGLQVAAAEPAVKVFDVVLRDRVSSAKEPTQYEVRQRKEQWEARKTAIIICDMWDLHHCKRAVERVREMAPRMNEVIARARSQGALIIHAPSECMAPYEKTPMRQRAKEAPRAGNLPADIGSGCRRIPAEEKGTYPIDQSDGGEDDGPAEHAAWAAKLSDMGRNPRAPWKSQIDVLKMSDEDAVTDSGVEVWNLLEARAIEHIILLGVHTNMCVLGRPFGLRQLVKNGKKAVLMRDMTDTMYNPARPPRVSHFRGTELIIEHIEKYVCPTITSDQFLGGKSFRFKDDVEPRGKERTEGRARTTEATVCLRTPMTPPTWALLERELLRANATACRAFFERYFDERGYLQCVERWGGDDGPDDAIENCADWPLLHALGAEDVVFRMYSKAWEGHLRQYTAAHTTKVPFARDGMYYNEFPVMFDWLHNSEGLIAFAHEGLCAPKGPNFVRRARRFAGLYMNEDPSARNYDPEHHLIRSLFNGSRGPLLRKATALDWAGDPIEVAGHFRPGHGERSYEEMLAHFKDYTDIVGDHPQNLLSTSLAVNAYLLTHEAKYRDWVLEYVGAWRQRMADNGGIIPTNVGLDGTIGGAAGGKWYGGTYGWAFTVTDTRTGQPAHRNTHYLGLIGFGNAYLLTGDDRYLDCWRKMIDTINAQGKKVDGRMVYPHMHGDKGWYNFTPQKYDHGAFELWYWSMAKADRERLPTTGWVAFLEGKEPGYPEEALRADLASIRQKMAGMRADKTTPTTRLSDDPLAYSPAAVRALTQLTLGGLPMGKRASPLHCRVRYFDPVRKRAGLPEDVGGLVEKLTADTTVLTLVSLNQVEPRTVVLQAGAYGEHEWTDVACEGNSTAIGGPLLTIRLEPGTGARLTLGTKRYHAAPTLAHPWDRAGP